MNKLEVKDNYADVTKKWLNTATHNSHKVKEQPYFDYNCVRYKIDNKNVVLDYSKEELEMAYFLENKFGGEMYMLPRINKPDGIKTADYLWRGEYWDLKTISTNGKNVIDNRLNGRKNQATNMILDISKNSLSDTEVDKQIEKIYLSPTRDWIEKIILIRDYKLIKIYKRKR